MLQQESLNIACRHITKKGECAASSTLQCSVARYSAMQTTDVMIARG